MPLKTTFFKNKITRQISSESIWPCSTKINGFEIHNGVTELDISHNKFKIKSIFKDNGIGWYRDNDNGGTIAGTYIHGIFENDDWREKYINLIKKRKNISISKKEITSYKIKRESIINKLANEFDKHLKISSLLN